MRYLSLFSGIEAASCAWQPLGWELVGVCEIEKFPCNVLKHHYPDVPNLGDITQVGKAQLDTLGSIDLIVGGSPCFTADTLVTTDHGPVPICDIKVGDIVLTHKGRWQKVLRIGHKQAETIYVKGQGAILHCTRNHPIWARGAHSKWNIDKHVYDREFEPMNWVPAEQLDHMYWGALTKSDSLEVPQPKLTGNATVTFDPYDLNVLELAGRYLADGDVRIYGGNDGERHGSIRISCGEYRRAVMDDLKQRVPFSCTEIKERTSIRYQFFGKSLAKWIEQNFGRCAGNKYIPSWVYGLKISQKAALLKGYLDGDGCRKHNYWQCSTISKKLAVGIKMLAEHLGVSVSITYVKKDPTCVIEGRTVNQHSYWELYIYDKARSSFEVDGWRWGLVRKIIPGEVETVYNLEVEHDNSYIADGICAHNCQGFSVAGKQEGLKDVRSKLAIDYLRVINTVKPKWIVWENVPGVFSTGKGMDFKLFTATLTHFGYGICWRVLDAQWFGVGQRRRRVFLVGYLGDWRPAYKVLFESQSLPGYFETLKRTKERLTASAERSSGKTGRCYDMSHPCDVIRTCDDNKTPTLTARAGTGGNNIPLVTDDTVFLERQFFCSNVGKANTLTRDIYRDPPAVLSNPRHADDVVHEYIEQSHAHTSATRKDQPIILDDQGGRVMNVSDDGKVGTLRAETHNHQPIVIESYRIGSYHSNGMKSDNPHSGIYKTETANTLDASDPTPACQQGGIAVIQGSVIGRKVENGPQGSGINIDKCFNLNTTDRHAVCFHARVRKLTPKECLRLQGFPDNWFEGVEGYSDTAAYKAIGNSMCVNVMHWLGKHIDTVEKE